MNMKSIALLIFLLTISFISLLSLRVAPVLAQTQGSTIAVCTKFEPPSFSKEWLRKNAYVKNNMTRVILGVKKNMIDGAARLRTQSLLGASRIVDSVSIKGKTVAFIVEVPLDDASSFATCLQETGLAAYIEPDVKVQAQFVPNDPKWVVQYGPRKVHAEEAWNITRGSHDLLVAVVDTGIDYNHPDLAANYVPLGYNWVLGNHDPQDDYGHGTHVAGTIAAVSDNGIGVAGLANVSVMAEKVLASDGSGYFDWIANGIINATDAGAKIISMSLGSSYDSQLVHDAVNYAYESGVLLIAAAGNDGADWKEYPAGYDEVVAVAATDASDKTAHFSNYGDWVEVAAPGVGICSTMPIHHVTLNDYGIPMNYANLSGTSMACPHVSGIAALIWSNYPNMTRDSVRRWLRYNGDDLGPKDDDIYYGYGRINAYTAVKTRSLSHDAVSLDLDAPLAVKPNNTVTAKGTLVNFGKSNLDGINVTLLKDSEPLPNESVSINLNNGDSAEIAFQWTPIEAESCNLTLKLIHRDDDNSTNNEKSCSCVVRYPTTLHVSSSFPTIGDALHNSISGDTIQVSQGIYSEFAIIDKPNIRIIGESRDTTTIGGWGQGIMFEIRANNVTVSGFKIDGEIQKHDVVTGTTGIMLDDCSNANVSLNKITTSVFGIYTHYSRNNVLSQNIIERNELIGFWGDHMNDSIIVGNTIQSQYRPPNYRYPDDHFGLNLNACYNNSLTENAIVENEIGITSSSLHNNAIVENNISDNQVVGLDLQGSSNNISSNIFSDNGWHDTSALDAWDRCGLALGGGGSNTLRNNTLAGNYYNFGGPVNSQSLPDFIQDIDTSNTADGKPIRFWVSQRDAEMPPNSGYIALINCTNIRVDCTALENNREGMLVAYSANCTVSCCNLTDNQDGMYIVSSLHNIINGSRLSNEVVNVYLQGSVNNTIFHNDFLNSALVYSTSPNLWDNGYPAGGNYWYMHHSPDQKSGSNQDASGSDGIVDTPYVINANNRDRYPLVNPWTQGWQPLIHDIAVTDLTASKTNPNPGETITLYATIKNLGNFSETSTLRLYVVGGQNISARNITLSAGGQSVETFTWTVPSTSGTYVVRAEAVPVVGEITTENNHRDITITVTGGGGGGGGQPPRMMGDEN